MYYKITYEQNLDGSYNILLFINEAFYEFGEDFSSWNKLKTSLEKNIPLKKSITIRTIKIVLISGVILSIPFSQWVASANTNSLAYAMSYVYFGSVEDQIKNISKSASVLNTVSPSYFDLHGDGSLKPTKISKTFVQSMQSKGIKVVPFLSNHWDRDLGIRALENREALANEIVAVIESNHLDGINIDIENITHLQRDLYTDFVRILREKLPKDKEVSVAVAANPRGFTTGWHGSYDYEQLQKYADHLFIMSYDEHYSGSTPGPVASLDFVEASTHYALKYVPKEKIVLGIPFFGRIWKTDHTIKGDGISLNKIAELKKLYQTTDSFDIPSQSPVLRFTIQPEDPTYILNGKPLTSGDYVIWYENEESLKEKLTLVNKYAIKGVGNWSAGQETADVWDYYELWLNGKYFADIQNYFAKDAIIRVTTQGFMKGISNSLFAPNANLTRGEAAVVVSRILSLGRGSNKNHFTDISGHWAEKEIQSVAAFGIIKGYEDGSFRPNEIISRAEMASILSRMIEQNYRDSYATEFTDVPSDYWAYEEIYALVHKGIINGYTDQTFRPNNPLSRGELAVLIEKSTDFILK